MCGSEPVFANAKPAACSDRAEHAVPGRPAHHDPPAARVDVDFCVGSAAVLTRSPSLSAISLNEWPVPNTRRWWLWETRLHSSPSVAGRCSSAAENVSSAGPVRQRHAGQPNGAGRADEPPTPATGAGSADPKGHLRGGLTDPPRTEYTYGVFGSNPMSVKLVPFTVAIRSPASPRSTS